ncbi:aldose 1-epimerase family protein [bacterium D16-51]|nr:aldose 1-epimerase family protein [bacterium D16-59]RKI60756.1 aldose 1-epimerase family protein [bacterium D16-51]
MFDYKISNGYLEAGFNAKGAELVHLQDLEKGQEYMWSGDSTYWNRVSPVLFPFVGKLEGQSYQYKGQRYENIPQHAFARDQVFQVLEQSQDEIWFELQNNEDTEKIYPFAFSLMIGYRLEKKKLHVMWEVHNRNDKKMYFSIGAHPGFLCPQPGSKDSGMEGYSIDLGLEAEAVTSGILTDQGVLGSETKELALAGGSLPLTEQLFSEDALILDAADIHSAAIKNPSGEVYLRMEFNAPLLGIWSPPGKHAPFVCIEPWYGRCDREGFSGTLQEREYGNVLGCGEVFEQEYTIEIV